MAYEWAVWLGDVLRASGCGVVEHTGWQTRGLPGGTFTPRAVVWHHDASPPGDSPSVPLYLIKNFTTASAQTWVDRAGTWHLIGAGRAPHAGSVLPGKPGNSTSIGVEADHTVGEEWPAAQLLGLRKGTAAILTRLGVPASPGLEFHKTICDPPGRKVDPAGLDLAMERVAVEAIRQGPAIPTAIEEGDDMTPEQAESLAECRRMLAVLLGAQAPAPGETRPGGAAAVDVAAVAKAVNDEAAARLKA